MQSEILLLEYKAILEWVKPDASVLDLGCGNGELLALLVREKSVKAQGIEIDEQAIYQCVAKGLSVFHEDIDNGLSGYGDKAFDYVILNQSLQQVKKPDIVLDEVLRVGREAVVGFPNFAYYQGRLQIFFKGKTPVTSALPYKWYDTPNLHFLSIADFSEYCRQKNITIEKKIFLSTNKIVRIFPNLLAEIGIFLISK